MDKLSLNFYSSKECSKENRWNLHNFLNEMNDQSCIKKVYGDKYFDTEGVRRVGDPMSSKVYNLLIFKVHIKSMFNIF
jgi:hypothetical protein